MTAPLPDTSFDILLSLATGPKHGYAMIREIEALHDGAHKPGPGLLYTTLPKLIKAGLIAPSPAPSDNTDPRRQYYRLTSLGASTVRDEVQRRVGIATRAQGLLGGLA